MRKIKHYTTINYRERGRLERARAEYERMLVKYKSENPSVKTYYMTEEDFVKTRIAELDKIKSKIN